MQMQMQMQAETEILILLERKQIRYHYCLEPLMELH